MGTKTRPLRHFVPVVLVLLVGGSGTAQGLSRCTPGSFRPLVEPRDGTPLAGAASTDGAFVIGENTVTLWACGQARARIQAGRRFTRIRARWADCGAYGKVRLRSWLKYPACDAFIGLLTWRDAQHPRRTGLKFETLRIE